MIWLVRPECPVELHERKEELTTIYKSTKKDVWNKRYIKEPLFLMSNGKCAFCECRLNEEGKYLQVEHFKPKSLYADEVVEWANLLPICNRCNLTKRDHDTGRILIIDPTVRNPKNHLRLENGYRLSGKDDIGECTVLVLDLNNTQQLCIPRMMIGNEVMGKIDSLVKTADEYNPEDSSVVRRLEVQDKIRALLQNGLPTRPYSAIVATTIFTYHGYKKLKTILEEKGLWSQQLEDLHGQLALISFHDLETSVI